MNRLQQILVGLLVVQVILAAALLWPRPAPAGAGSAPLLGLKAEEISGITIRDDQGKSIALARSAATGAGQAGWVLPDAGNYPVESNKITPLLEKLTAIKGNRLVAQTPAAHKRLKVADDTFARRLEIKSSTGTTTLYIGTSGGVSSSHVRLAGQDQVYLASGISEWEFGTGAASWVNPTYFTVPQADVTALTLRNAKGEWTFRRGADGNWTMEGLAAGETLNSGSVQTLLSSVSNVALNRPLGVTEDPAYGLAQPSAVVTITAKGADGEKTYTLTVGAQDPDDKTYVVKSSESAYYVRVAEYSVRSLVENGREAYIQVTPTPAPEAGPATPQATPTP